MDAAYPWLGDLNRVAGLAREAIGLICLVASVICGALVGFERERRDKPAGLRTMVLISVGATIFTMVSLLIAKAGTTADPGRIAAQIIPGIGFLGAGAIIRERGTVLGLTTGATIWAVAAVGVTIGSGHVAAGAVFTLVIFLTLTVVHKLDWVVVGRCRRQTVTLRYKLGGGKTRPRLQFILDYYHVPDCTVAEGPAAGEEGELVVPICTTHRHHRAVLKELAEVPETLEIRVGGAAG
ncbi:MAG: MgtC/SapB family protein, partial [Planctomycetes bacterium]|nr:MgtC/SapB family protein [Planctomycetota bacterium]